MRSLLYPFIRRNPYYMRGGGLDKALNPPNPDQQIQYFDGTTYESNGSTYYEDKSVSGGDVEMSRSIQTPNGVDNYGIGDCSYDDFFGKIVSFKFKYNRQIGNSPIVGFSDNIGRRYDIYVYLDNLRVIFPKTVTTSSVYNFTDIYFIDGEEYYVIFKFGNDIEDVGVANVDGIEYSNYTETSLPLSTTPSKFYLNKIGAGDLIPNNYNGLSQVYDWSIADSDGTIEHYWSLREKSGKTHYDTVGGCHLAIMGDRTSYWDNSLTLDTPRLVRNYSLWRNDDPDKDDIEVSYLNDGTPIATEGGTPPDTGYYWVEDYENSVEATYVTEADGFTWFRDRYDDKDNGDGTITKHPDAVQYQSMFTVPPFSAPYTISAISPNYENADKYFSNPDNNKQLWYAGAQSNEDQGEIYDIIGGVQPYQVTEGDYQVTEGDYFVTE